MPVNPRVNRDGRHTEMNRIQSGHFAAQRLHGIRRHGIPDISGRVLSVRFGVDWAFS